MIAGLGNPGPEYAGTRHNVGFAILDLLADNAGAAFRFSNSWIAEVATANGLILCKPASYMNASGEPVSAVAHYYKIPPNEILIVLDDVSLPIGKLRLRLEGSSGGHNGLQSIIDLLGTQAVPRLRIGIGGAENSNLTGHVLGRFSPEEKDAVRESLARAVEAIQFAQANGIVAAMNNFN